MDLGFVNLNRMAQKQKTPRTDPGNTGSKKKSNVFGFPWGFCMDFLGNQTRMNFPGNRMGMDFLGNQTGVEKKQIITRLD